MIKSLAKHFFSLSLNARCFALLAAVMLLFTFSLTIRPSSSVYAQDDEIVRINTDLVVLNVTATNSRGEYARDLEQSNFKVFEDNLEQRITTFSVEETPFAAALLLDTSGSMEKRLSLARSAAIRFLDGLRAEDVAAVYKFDSEIEQIQDFSSSRDLAPLAYELRADGWTVLNDAIVRAAADLSKRPEKRKAIVVLSDGADTRSSTSTDKALASALAVGATIYAVDLSDANAPKVAAAVLRSFAVKSGGRFVPTPGGQALRDAFAGIVAELSNQYTLGYQPSNKARDGRWHTIEVKCNVPGIALRTRRGRQAPTK